MAIRRVKSRRSRRSTLVANPRRRVRRARRNPSRRKRTAARRNPARRSVARRASARRNPSRRIRRTAARRNPSRRIRRTSARRNPGMVIAGVPVLDMAIGSLGALVIVNTLKNLGPVKDQLDKIESAPLRAAIVPGLGAAAAFAVHKYAKSAQVKRIAQYAFIGCVFKLIDDATDSYFADEFPKMFSGGTGGVYMGSRGIANGAARPALAGAYMQTNGLGAVHSMKPKSHGLFGLA